MDQFTQNGITFDSYWIELSVARFRDQRIPRAFRVKEIEREIEMRETDLDLMLHAMPNDCADHAHSEAHLDALRRIRDELNASEAVNTLRR